jgi:hypothetical protein
MMPIGALLGGLLAAELGTRGAMWAMTGMLPLTSIFIVLSPLRRMQDLPTARTNNGSVGNEAFGCR